MISYAYAKINLSLDILSKRSDGYHEIDSVMQQISLCDSIEITKNKEGKINLTCAKMILPNDDQNIAYRAAQLFLDYFKIENMGVNIHIIKEIPCEAGLGGGSADAAAVLNAMNELFSVNASKELLAEISVKLGADVPFCVLGGIRRCTGLGEIMENVPTLPPCAILICKPDIGISTKEAYNLCDEYPQEDYFSTPLLIDALSSGNIESVSVNISNRFDEILHIPEVEIIKSIMLEYGALTSCMTGSGSAVFGIYKDKEAANNAVSHLEKVGKVFLCTSK